MKKFLFTSTLIASALCANIAIANNAQPYHHPCNQPCNQTGYQHNINQQNYDNAHPCIQKQQAYINNQHKKLVIKMNILNRKQNIDAGEIIAVNTPYGVAFYPNLKGISSPGLHGFHVHENPNCGATGKGLGKLAGGHWDPYHAGKHSTPWDDNGHLGDLPPLYVAQDGSATHPVLSPKIKDVDQLRGHSLMIHYGSDNHSDMPKKLGGGGPRMVCGVIQ